MALAGGVSIMLEPRKMSSGSAQGMLSATGACHAFDVDADGFVSGEASAVLLLKRLDDAVADGDRVLAVIRGTAANQDGHTVNIATPSRDAQVKVYRVSPRSRRHRPRHHRHGRGSRHRHARRRSHRVRQPGSGLRHRRPVRARLGEDQLRPRPVRVRCGRPDEGHPRRCSMRRCPRTCTSPRCRTRWPASTRTCSCPQSRRHGRSSGDHPRRAAVSSYGLSGTNVHAILEQAPAGQAHSSPSSRPSAARASRPDGAPVFPLSATSADELRRTAGRLADWVEPAATSPTRDDVGGSGVHAGPQACAPSGADRRPGR